MITAKTFRIFSVIGIILLLFLQYVWFKNSYVLMEHDIIEKSETNLTKAVENELFERFKNNPLKVVVHNKNNIRSQFPTSEIVSNGALDQSRDFNIGLQEVLRLMGSPCSIKRVDSLFKKEMQDDLDFVPSHTIRFIDSKIKEKKQKSKFILYAKITEKQYIEIELKSPLGSIMRKAQYILSISLLLVVLIGVILIYQLKSMLRENHFVSFIKEYTHSLAHDLKTPISGIYMIASQLSSGVFEEKPESRQRYYQMCKDQSSKLLATVDRILLVAKAEHSKIIPNIVVTEIKPYIDKIVDNRRQNNFRMKDIVLSTTFQTESMIGSFDPFLMENVLNNLIDNAVKYSDKSVKIEVASSFMDGKLRISVKDNGFGIAKKEQKHIFESFERGDKVQGKGIDGFGIGLNYVNKVIQAHKGKIFVESEEGLGSEFIIELPSK